MTTSSLLNPAYKDWLESKTNPYETILLLEKSEVSDVDLSDISEALEEYVRLFKAEIASPAEILTLSRAYPDEEKYSLAVIDKELDQKEPVVIGGPASVEVVDREGHIITVAAMKRAFDRFMDNFRTRNAMVLHSDVQVGWALPAYISKTGKIYKSGVTGDHLFFITELRDDTKISKKVLEQIDTGKMKSYSIAGSATSVEPSNKDGAVVMQVNDMELAEVTICEQGVNQRAKFELMKADADRPTSSCVDGSCLIKSQEHKYSETEIIMNSNGEIDAIASFTNWVQKYQSIYEDNPEDQLTPAQENARRALSRQRVDARKGDKRTTSFKSESYDKYLADSRARNSEEPKGKEILEMEKQLEDPLIVDTDVEAGRSARKAKGRDKKVKSKGVKFPLYTPNPNKEYFGRKKSSPKQFTDMQKSHGQGCGCDTCGSAASWGDKHADDSSRPATDRQGRPTLGHTGHGHAVAILISRMHRKGDVVPFESEDDKNIRETVEKTRRVTYNYIAANPEQFPDHHKNTDFSKPYDPETDSGLKPAIQQHQMKRKYDQNPEGTMKMQKARSQRNILEGPQGRWGGRPASRKKRKDQQTRRDRGQDKMFERKFKRDPFWDYRHEDRYEGQEDWEPSMRQGGTTSSLDRAAIRRKLKEAPTVGPKPRKDYDKQPKPKKKNTTTPATTSESGAGGIAGYDPDFKSMQKAVYEYLNKATKEQQIEGTKAMWREATGSPRGHRELQDRSPSTSGRTNPGRPPETTWTSSSRERYPKLGYDPKAKPGTVINDPWGGKGAKVPVPEGQARHIDGIQPYEGEQRNRVTSQGIIPTSASVNAMRRQTKTAFDDDAAIKTPRQQRIASLMPQAKQRGARRKEGEATAARQKAKQFATWGEQKRQIGVREARAQTKANKATSEDRAKASKIGLEIPKLQKAVYAFIHKASDKKKLNLDPGDTEYIPYEDEGKSGGTPMSRWNPKHPDYHKDSPKVREKKAQEFDDPALSMEKAVYAYLNKAKPFRDSGLIDPSGKPLASTLPKPRVIKPRAAKVPSDKEVAAQKIAEAGKKAEADTQSSAAPSNRGYAPGPFWEGRDAEGKKKKSWIGSMVDWADKTYRERGEASKGPQYTPVNQQSDQWQKMERVTQPQQVQKDLISKDVKSLGGGTNWKRQKQRIPRARTKRMHHQWDRNQFAGSGGSQVMGYTQH